MSLLNKVDALLPQTQCELCTYKGCLPYAQAIVEEDEAIDLCLPGGVRVLRQLGVLLDRDTASLESSMKAKQKNDCIVTIKEEECIGCKKCIQACPVDAIVGAAKLMHTVISDVCNGCELCLSPCPVDCIDVEELPPRSNAEQQRLADQSRHRFDLRNNRLVRQEQLARRKHQQAKNMLVKKSVSARQQAIEEAMQRVKIKRKG
jgi:Na+-translocating ferredoxin:NAD+ oxidoreductase subunit B